MEKLSRMQQRVYDYIAESIAEHGYAPSVREVGEALGLKSPSTVHFHIKHLQEMGLIEKSAGKGRAITLKKQLQAVPVAPQPVEIDELAPRRRQVPILGNVAAGNPILAQECIEDYLTFDTGGHDDEYFALRVRGESMLGVGILPDDLVVVHRQSIAQNGQIVVALIGDEATVKTLKRKGSEVWLHARKSRLSAHRRPREHDTRPRRRRGAAVLREKANAPPHLRRSVFCCYWGKCAVEGAAANRKLSTSPLHNLSKRFPVE